ncbi:OPT family oligopeptide transporter [Sporobolomyces koalae]|uniref:OPT family oligopeptide transporter n=1 Tax=Sporobolomyces koalae TaxID=500713 RepID=UPI00317B5893
MSYVPIGEPRYPELRQESDDIPLRDFETTPTSNEEQLRQHATTDEGVDQEDDELAEEADALIGSSRTSRGGTDYEKAQNPIFPGGEELDAAADIVRKVVPETDDPSVPTLTIRVVILGTGLCVLGAAISQLFFFKSNAPSFSTFFIILVAYPLGKWLARILPPSLNHPAPFSKKEHVLVGVLASSGASAAYAGEIVAVQELYYHSDLGTLGGLLLLLSTQLIGFGLSGLTYRLLVRPTAMLWPSQLVTVSLYQTLHGKDEEEVAESKERMRFFSFSFASIFAWQWIPSVVFPTLTSIAVLCLINNQSWVLRTLGSGYNGFGVLDFSLDWSVIGGTGALYTPFFAQCSYFAGLAFNLWLVTPILYFSNFWNARSYDSPVGAHLYNSTFGRLDVKEILNKDLSLNAAKYEAVGPLRLAPYFALSYGISFAILMSAVTSVLLWNVKDIKGAILAGREEKGDIHVQMLERNYPNVPSRWYLMTFGVNFAAAAILLVFYPTLQLPVWGLVLAVMLAVMFLVPIGIISAITNTTIGLNVITEFVAGYIWPGKPLANVAFKCYGYMTMLQSLDLTSDLKLGLYMKIPPRHLFLCQVGGTALGSITNYSLIKGVIAAKRPFLDGSLVDPTAQWTGRRVEIFFSASVIFGLVSPSRFFVGEYRSLYWGFLLGAILPVVPWLLYRRSGNRFWKQISVPLLLHGSIGPPQTPMNVLVPGFIVSFLSQFYALRYQPRWFEKYNYVLSSALDAGTSINALVIYILGANSFYTWWGNSSIDTEHCIPGS